MRFNTNYKNKNFIIINEFNNKMRPPLNQTMK